MDKHAVGGEVMGSKREGPNRLNDRQDILKNFLENGCLSCDENAKNC